MFPQCYCQLGPKYEGQLTRKTEPIPYRSILLVLTHDFIIIQSNGPTGGDGHEWLNDADASSAPFLCRLRRRECCMLGASSSQPTSLYTNYLRLG